MLYMIELQYPVEQRDRALRYFLKHGTIGYDGKVTLTDAWVATQDHVAFAIVEAQEREEVEKACVPLHEFGDVNFRPVTSVDQL